MATSKISNDMSANATYLNGSSKDLNDYSNTGFFTIGTDVVNSPVNYAWLMIIRSPGSDNACVQVLIKPGMVHIRAFTGNPLAWTNWYKVNLTEQT